jgi:hypothetical protein
LLRKTRAVDPDTRRIHFNKNPRNTNRMRPNRVSVSLRLSWLLVALGAASAPAQETSYKIEPLKQAAPEGLSEAVRGALEEHGYKVVDGQGKIYAEVWLRKSVPASEPPAGPKGTVQFPCLTEGELIGALRFPGEGHDYRDQTIAKGVYTLRYGLQPVNGDHLGVSTYRDYALLLASAKDKELADIASKPLSDRSAEAAGTSHPAVLLLLTPAATAPPPPSVTHDGEKGTWGANLPLHLNVKGTPSKAPLNIQLIVVGAAAA